MFLTLDCSLAGGTIPLEFVRMPYMAGKFYDMWGQQPGTTLEPISKLTPVNAGVNYLAPLSSLQTREAAVFLCSFILAFTELQEGRFYEGQKNVYPMTSPNTFLLARLPQYRHVSSPAS